MLDEINDLDRLKRINQALMNRVESQLDQQGSSFSLFQTALNLEGQVKRRTDELTGAMHRLEKINVELAEAKEAADFANHSKTSFLAAASHDVLQPLNAALLSVSVLADLQTKPKGHELVSQVERSLENMNALLSTLIDISRLETGVVQPTIEFLSINSVLDSLKSDFQPIAHSKNLTLDFGNTPHAVTSDRTMLRRILQNLVSNAIRYTDKGGVSLVCIAEDDVIKITISDTGRGIAQDRQKEIFEEFNRGDSTCEILEGGTIGFGLGLSIVKKMVSALGHHLELDSDVGVGTKFTLVVNRAHIDEIERRKPVMRTNTAQADLTGTRILLLENEPAVIEAMMILLESWKCEAFVATCQQEAIDLLGDTANLPQIIIADQHLNHGDLGTVALESIWQYLGRPIPALVASADPTELLEQETTRLGLELLVKPIKPATLRALLTHLLSV